MARINVRGGAEGGAPGDPRGRGAGGTVQDGVAAAVERTEVAPWIVLLARVGYAAKGAVYIVIGALAARLALGNGGGTTDSRGALRVIADGPLGSAALVVIGLGLIGYAIWRLISAVTDPEARGSEAKGIALRIGQAVRGIAYGALGVEALRLLGSARARGGDAPEHWTARVLGAPSGKWIVAAGGAIVIGYALYQLWRATTDKVRRWLDLSRARPEVATWIVRLGRFGIAARAVVFGIIGVLLLRAGLQRDPSEAGGIGDSLLALAHQPYGMALLAVVAIGLIAYGVYQLGTARYRRMRLT